MITLQEHPKHYKGYYLDKEDWLKLSNYYSQSVPFVGTSGKYYISSSIVYPRYKIKTSFETFNQTSTSKRSMAKNESYADYIVIPVKQFKYLLTNQAIQSTLDGKPVVIWNYIGTSTLTKLKNLINYYNSEHSSKPFIDFDDFSSNLDALKERLTIPKTEYIINLLKGDSSSLKLGMELLTNFDTSRSVVALCYCLSEVDGYSIRNHDYFNSTAFKSFRERFINVAGKSVEYFGGLSKPRLYDETVRILNDYENASITTIEYKMFKDLMCEWYIDKASDDDVILNITPDNLTLKINEDKIISDESIEEEDRLRQEAALEDASSSYYLLDDTTETA